MKCKVYIVLLLLIFIGHSTSIYAQRKDTDAKIPFDNFKNVDKREKVGNAPIRVRYAFNATDLNDRATWIDEGQLKISPKMSDYSSRFIEVNEDSLAVWLENHPNYNAYPPTRWLQGYKPDQWIEYQYSQIITNGLELQEWCAMPSALDSENMYYNESLPLMDWQLQEDIDTICGYECQKATCRWRGRDYMAWFAPELPFQLGPWKFGGLPGLIMKISDSDEIYTFEAVAVEQGNFPIYKPRGSRYTKVSRDVLRKLQYNLNENYLKTTGVTVILYKTGQPLSSRKHKYSQMELE